METIDNNIIFQYFTFEEKNFNESVPIVKLHLKDVYKINKPFPLKCVKNNKRISLTGKNYYIHYLGEKIGLMVYNQRKLLRKQYDILIWYSINVENNVDIKNKLKDASERLRENEKKLHSDIKNEFWKSNAGILLKEKYSSYIDQHKKISLKNKSLWDDVEYRKKSIEHRKAIGMYNEQFCKKISSFYQNPKNKKYISSIMNNPDRVRKISEHAKLMWTNAKLYNKELYYRMVNTSKNKNYELNGYKMNSIEYNIGKCLCELGLDWEYEKIFNFENVCYLPDFYIKPKKIVIECYGDFWHANPKLFTENKTTHKNRTAKQVWEYDRIKQDTFEKNGYKYLYFWENDVMSNMVEIKEKIKKYYEQ